MSLLHRTSVEYLMEDVVCSNIGSDSSNAGRALTHAHLLLCTCICT